MTETPAPILITNLAQLPRLFYGPYYVLPKDQPGKIYQFQRPYTGRVVWYMGMEQEKTDKPINDRWLSRN